MKVKDIKAYEKNVKRHSDEQISNIAKAIKAYGFVQPIVVSKDGTIIIGHGRFRAAAEVLGWKEMKEASSAKKGESFIPYVLAEWLDEDKIRELRIADNKLNESPWDVGNLAIELAAIDLPINELGFSNIELDKMGITQEPTGIPDLPEGEDASSASFDIPTATPSDPVMPAGLIQGTQGQKRPITFFCDPKEYEFLSSVYATSRKYEFNVELLMQNTVNSQSQQ